MATKDTKTAEDIEVLLLLLGAKLVGRHPRLYVLPKKDVQNDSDHSPFLNVPDDDGLEYVLVGMNRVYLFSKTLSFDEAYSAIARWHSPTTRSVA